VLQWQVDFSEATPAGTLYNAQMIMRGSDIWVSGKTIGDNYPVVYRVDVADGAILAYWVGKEEVSYYPRLALDDVTGSVWVGCRFGGTPSTAGSFIGYRIDDDGSELAETDEYSSDGPEINASGGYLYFARINSSFYKIDESGNEISSHLASGYGVNSFFAYGGTFWKYTINALVRQYTSYSVVPFTDFQKLYYSQYGEDPDTNWSLFGIGQAVGAGNYFAQIGTTSAVFVDNSEEHTSSGYLDVQWVHTFETDDLTVRAIDASQLVAIGAIDEVNTCKIFNFAGVQQSYFEFEHALPIAARVNGDAIAMLTSRVLIP
jgi:hypothetical protein